jgi:DNA-binding SARP family transcriptional activator
MTASGVVIELLGRFQVTVDGVTIGEAGWPGRRSVELVQLLALAPGHRLVRDEVIDALWPHLDAEAGGANLRKAAHHARRTLGPAGSIVLQAGQVSLFPRREVTTDLEDFEAIAAAALASDDPDRCRQAVERYGGELLPRSRYEDWTCEARQRVHRRFVDVLRTAQEWERLVEVEPTDEGAYQALMRQALAGGVRTAVIRWYRQARSALAAELGVTPSEETEALYAAAIDGSVAGPATVVGRDVELARVTAALRDAAAERTGALVLRGPAGIGKSALCREIARLAQADGRVVRWAGPMGTGQVFGPLIGLVDELLLGSRTLLAAVGTHVRSVLAILTDAAAPAPAPDGPVSRHQVMGALRQVLRACSEGRDTVIVLDDAQLADDATLDVVFHLASSVPDLLVVLAYRQEPAHPTLERGLARLQRAGRAVTIDLDPLDAGAARELAVRSAGWDLEPELVDRIVDLAEGNPFATVELARNVGPGRVDLPPTVVEAVATRFVDLDPATVGVLQRLALVGDDFEGTSVVALTGRPEPEAHAALDRALDAGVLVVAGSRYRFRHDLVRQALVERVPPHQRLAVHRDAAQRLAELGAPPAAVARHWLAAGLPGEAVEWSLSAARRAMQVGAFSDARQHVGRVLEHDPGHPAARRIEAEALDMIGDPQALAAYAAAIAVADAADVGDLVAMRALAQIKQGDPRGALVAVTDARPTSVEGRLSEALAYAGAAALGVADPAMGTQKAAECRRIALETGDRAAIVIASWAHAAAAHARGELRDSVLADLRDTRDLPHLAVRVFDGHLCITQRFLYGARPYPDVIAFADGIAAEARRLGAVRGQAFGLTLRGEAELLSGRLDEAEADLTDAVHLHRATAGAVGEAHALQRLAEVALHTDRPARARDLVAEALDVARVTDIGFHLFDRIYGTRIAMAVDADEALAAVDEAEDAVRGPLETCPGCRITFAVPAAIACAKAGALDRAAEHAQASEFLAHVVMRLPAWDAAYHEVLAHLAQASGDVARGRAHFASAADGYVAAGHPLDARRCAALARTG